MTDDWFDFLIALLDAEARFLVVGAHALAVHGIPRGTQDLDVWIDTNPGNVERVWRALATFGAPVDSPALTMDDLRRAGSVVQIGLPPNRIDVLTSISGIPEFGVAWESRVEHVVRGRAIPFIGRDTLIRNKLASGRRKDIVDAEILGAEVED